MSDILSGTLEEIAEQVGDINIKLAILVAYDRENSTWRVVNVDEDGNLKTVAG